MEERFITVVRPAIVAERREETWRPVDVELDSFEPQWVKTDPWPDDLTTLYWWRPTFWRRACERGAP